MRLIDDEPYAEQALRLAREMGAIRPRDLVAHGIPARYASRLARQGALERIDHGLYTAVGGAIHEHQTLVEVSQRMPHAVICLLSALRFHDLTSQAPFEVWVMVDDHAYVPREMALPVRVVYASGAALTEGVERRQVLGATIRVTSPAKTVADCFKYRSKVGLDVALEALRETWRERRATMDELWRAAQVCRVTRVMRPYLESLETLA